MAKNKGGKKPEPADTSTPVAATKAAGAKEPAKVDTDALSYAAPASASPPKWSGTVIFIAIVVAVVIGIGSIVKIYRNGSKQQDAAAGECLPYSSTAVHRCIVTEKPRAYTTEEPTKLGQYEFCVVKPTEAVIVMEKIGVNTYMFSSKSGAFPIQYKLLERSALVDGKCPSKF